MKNVHLRRYLLKSALVGLFVTVSHSAYAVAAHDGFYAGVLLGQSYMSPITSESIIPVLTAESNNGFECFYNDLENRLPPEYINADGTPTVDYNEFVFKLGYDIDINVGYKISNFRLELEGIWNNFGNQAIQPQGAGKYIQPPAPGQASFREGVGGTTQIMAGMLNFYFDFDDKKDNESSDDLVPYIGIGIGHGNIRRIVKICNPVDRLLETEGRNAYQIIVGTQYNADDYTTFSIDYRYFTTTDQTLGSLIGTSNTSKNVSTVLFGNEFKNHSINLTITHHFLDNTGLLL